MSKKENKQQEAEKDLNKKSDKKVSNSNKTQEKPQSFTTTVSLVDCTYCETLQELVKKYKAENKAALDLIRSQEKMIRVQDNLIYEQQATIERQSVLLDFFQDCLKWTEKHLGFFASRKYSKLFSGKALAEHLINRGTENICEGRFLEADVDKDMLQDTLNLMSKE